LAAGSGAGARLAGGNAPRPCGGGGGGTLLYERVRAGGGGNGFVAAGGKDWRCGGCIAGDDRESATSELGFCDGDTPSLPRFAVRPAYLCRAYCFIDSLMR
jgi:hypothetical protein